MGCLNLDICLVNDVDFVIDEFDSSFNASILTINDAFGANVNQAYESMTFDLGLVCMSNVDTECYLRLSDGCFLTVDGCYVKVLKS